MKTGMGYLMVILAGMLMTSSPVESGPITASFCIYGCNVAFGVCTSCGVGAVVGTVGAATPAVIAGCTLTYTACVGACTTTTVLPTP